MALQNRVTPEGDIVADPARGTLMGNRGGRLHRPDRTLGPARWRSRAWIACTLSFRDRHRTVMAPDSYTELFFLDEATACAAGHRPCAECRRADYTRFKTLWTRTLGPAPRAADIDRALHAARLDARRRKAILTADLDSLPDGAMIRAGDGPRLVRGDATWLWTHAGYTAPDPRTPGPVQVLTPAPLLALMSAGYAPGVHPSAG